MTANEVADLDPYGVQQRPDANISVFVIGPIGDKFAPIGSAPRQAYEDALQTYESVIQAACSQRGLEPVRADEIDSPGEIPQQVFEQLRDATIVIADLTGGNPNVMYELGLRHARGGCVIQIGEFEKLPFDVSVIRTIKFARNEPGLIAARKALERSLDRALAGDCPPVTATRVLGETRGVELVVGGGPSLAEPELSEDEEPGFIEVLAEMEAALPRFGERLQEQTLVMNRLAELANESSAEIEQSDAAGGGFAGRAGVATRLATKLNAEADRLEETVGAALLDLASVDAGINYLIGEVEQDPQKYTELGELPDQIARLAEASTRSVSAAIGSARSFEELGKASRLLRPPTRRLASSLRRTDAYAETPARWQARLKAIGAAAGAA